MIIASKGAAGVTGAGLATLAGGLQSHRPDLVDGVGLIVGIDRFMSEARALTNFAGNAVATVLVGHWVGEFDKDQARQVFAGEDPFDEAAFAAGDPHAGDVPEAATASESPPASHLPTPPSTARRATDRRAVLWPFQGSTGSSASCVGDVTDGRSSVRPPTRQLCRARGEFVRRNR